MKLALIYDRINKIGGAERVLVALHEIWPEAPIYTSVYNPKGAFWAKSIKIVPSFLQKFSWLSRRHELLAWLMPVVFESFDFSDYDVVISVTSEAAKGIIAKPNTLHLCYCLTPTRYLWSGNNQYFSSSIAKKLSQPIIKYLKHWDLIASRRPDRYIAISNEVQNRIKTYYDQESKVIYPPVEIDKFNCHSVPGRRIPACRRGRYKDNCIDPDFHRDDKGQTNYYLVVSRLVKYKKIDLVIKAFNELGWNLVIIGIGAEEKRLKTMAKSNIKFLGQLSDDQILQYYQGCLAVIFPTEEDFGIVPLEAQACGKPVIAYRKGGALETVIEGKTGEFFDRQTVTDLVDIIRKFNHNNYQAKDCRLNAERFSKSVFQGKFKKFVSESWQEYKLNKGN